MSETDTRKKQLELIAMVRAGQRIQTEHSLFVEAHPEACAHVAFDHRWRTIVCDGDCDVVECSRCGVQAVCACNFEGDML